MLLLEVAMHCSGHDAPFGDIKLNRALRSCLQQLALDLHRDDSGHDRCGDRDMSDPVFDFRKSMSSQQANCTIHLGRQTYFDLQSRLPCVTNTYLLSRQQPPPLMTRCAWLDKNTNA